jgi:putative peptide zinc metalloprotease protein
MTPESCVPVRLRPDVTAKRIALGTNADWVIRDPLSRNFFYFSEAEYCILRMLDGKRSWNELASDVSRRLTPEFIDIHSLAHFITDAKSKGLVEATDLASEDVEPKAQRIKTRAGKEPAWWHQPLAIRLPGIYPDRYLQHYFGQDDRFFRNVISATWLWTATVLLWLVAIAVAISHMDRLAIESSLLATTLTPRHILLFGLCIGFTKILHELGHAVACKIFGGECREIGLMFLFGVPCLYCDVSDAWMMPQRWKRVLVSAAGMIVEVTLASIALIGWVLMTPGPWRDSALMIAVIGSVNSVLINGNPLLRYDGYFIFSDLVRVPNLGQEATDTLRNWLRRMVWGRQRVHGETVGREVRVAPRIFLIAYALASAAYRYMMLLAIVYAIYRFSAGHGMAWVAVAATVVLFGRNQYYWWKSIGRIPRSDAGGFASRYRWLAIRCLFLILVAWVWFTPFSRTISVPFLIRPVGQQELYVTVPGRIVNAVSAGAQVQLGSPVLTLINESADRELKSLETDRRELVAKVQALKLQQSVRRNSSAEILALESAIESLDQRVKWQREQIERLTVRAPADGTIFSPIHRSSKPADEMIDETAQAWSGSPLSLENVGAWLDMGTLVGIIGHETKREAVLMVGQSQIQWVGAGQIVELLRNDFDVNQRRGIVRDVSYAGATEESIGMSNQFSRAATVPRSSTDRVYRVLVEMVAEESVDVASSSGPAIPVRSVGLAKITVEPMSMHQRTHQLLREMFAVP